MNEGFQPDLHGLIQTIEKDLFGNPESVIGPLRELLRRCNGDRQLCYAYSQLGFAYLRLAEHRMSKIFYEHALQLQPNDIYILANLAHAVYELGDRSKGVEYGRRALQLKDEMSVATGGAEMGAPNGGGVNLISFSLYGKKAKYCETAVLNCLAARHHLPEFVCRFHVDQTVPDDVIRRLRDQAAEIVFVSGRAASFPGTFWRFLALDEKDANFVLVRDADSIIDAREAYCVNEWIDSKKPFHIIRDDCCHTELILAGLFGARSGILGDIEEKIAAFIASDANRPIGRFSDQIFLRTCVWPTIREHAVTHDSVYGYGADVRAIPSDVSESSGFRNHFIGSNYANYRLQLSAPETSAENVSHFLRIIDEEGRTICEHQMEPVGNQHLELFVPLSYAQKIQAGAWRCEIVSAGSPTRSR